MRGLNVNQKVEVPAPRDKMMATTMNVTKSDLGNMDQIMSMGNTANKDMFNRNDTEILNNSNFNPDN